MKLVVRRSLAFGLRKDGIDAGAWWLQGWRYLCRPARKPHEHGIGRCVAAVDGGPVRRSRRSPSRITQKGKSMNKSMFIALALAAMGASAAHAATSQEQAACRSDARKY